MTAHSDARIPLNLRLAGPARALLGRLADHLGITETAVMELLLRQAQRETIPAPDARFTTWHDNAGTTEPLNRRVSETAIEAMHELTSRWDLSQSDTIEYLVFWRATEEGLRRPTGG